MKTPQELCDEWNAKHPVGTVVEKIHGGRLWRLKTNSQAEAREYPEGWEAMISLDDGGILMTPLDAIKPIEPTKTPVATCAAMIHLCQDELEMYRRHAVELAAIKQRRWAIQAECEHTPGLSQEPGRLRSQVCLVCGKEFE
jgi:hypothetical protein